VRFLIDECLHTSLVDVAQRHGHETGATDRGLMPRIVEEDFTFVTNNAADFRRLYARQEVHAGLVIIVPQVTPARQRALFASLLVTLDPDDALLNEVIEVSIDGEDVIITRYELPEGG
jgi:predicted nuclease of predicted toxin-antitoxin system